MAHASFLRSVVYQLLAQNASFFDVVAQWYRSPVSDKLKDRQWSDADTKRMLECISSTGTPITCIIDAMDEAKDPVDTSHSLTNQSGTHRIQTLFTVLQSLIWGTTGSKIKFVVFSRPEPSIEMDFNKINRSYGDVFRIILQQENRADIDLLIEKRLKLLRAANHAYDSESDDEPGRKSKRKYKGLTNVQSRVSTSEDGALNNIRSYLRDNADGVILWVTLVLGELEAYASTGMVTLKELEKRARSLPVELDKFYEYIVGRVTKGLSGEDLKKIRMTFILISGSATLGRPLCLREMWEALAVPSDVAQALKSDRDPIIANRIGFKSWLGFRRQLRRKCGALIEVVKGEDAMLGEKSAYLDVGPDDTVQFMHRTIKDFLESPEREGPLNFSEQHSVDQIKQIARRYIQIGFPSQPTRFGPVILPLTETEACDQVENGKRLIPYKKGCSAWRTNIRERVEYLQGKILLSFSLFILSSDNSLESHAPRAYSKFSELYPRRPEVYIHHSHVGSQSSDFDPQISGANPQVFKVDLPVLEVETENIDREFPFYPHLKSKVRINGDERSKAATVGYAFRYACANGLVIATRNLIELYAKFDQEACPLQDYVICNAALLASVEHDLLHEVRTLTRGQRHQTTSPFSISSWPLAGKENFRALDPFIKLAIRSGATRILGYLFDHTDQYYARTTQAGYRPMSVEMKLSSQERLRDIEVTSIRTVDLENISLTAEKDDVGQHETARHAGRIQENDKSSGSSLGFPSDAPFDVPSSLRSSSLPGNFSRLQYSSSTIFGLESLDLVQLRERVNYLCLKKSCFTKASEIRWRRSSGDDAEESETEVDIEDVREAVNLVIGTCVS